MSGFPSAARKARCWLPIILWSCGLNAQTYLMLSQPAITTDGTVLLDLSLFSSPGTEPAAIQWTFQYSSNVSSVTVEDGPGLTLVGKTTICAGDKAAYNCLAVGANTKTIANGVIAKVTAILVPDASTATILISNSLGASSTGYLIPVSWRKPVAGFLRLRTVPGGKKDDLRVIDNR